jgi:formylglycine-generating enzyme required for sulfatase activity
VDSSSKSPRTATPSPSYLQLRKRVSPVGPSPFGVLDMSGNVEDRTSSFHSADYCAPADPAIRVAQGGYWHDDNPRSTSSSMIRTGAESSRNVDERRGAFVRAGHERSAVSRSANVDSKRAFARYGQRLMGPRTLSALAEAHPHLGHTERG